MVDHKLANDRIEGDAGVRSYLFGAPPEAARRLLPLELQITILERAVADLKGRVTELSRDALTGAWGRHALDRVLATEVMRARRYGRPAGILMVDVDNLKRINDKHGHSRGDEALAAVAMALRGCLRGHDALVRYGGDEFCIVVDDARGAALEELARRIRMTVHAKGRALAAQLGCPVTVSLGATPVREQDSIPAALQRADAALLGAKRAGRDRTIIHWR